ncbi:hypothetical protein MKW92_009954 [Papaver armeniacum]|nr:hypothetical protein MKW92_009954 [Papaver armeniacum]
MKRMKRCHVIDQVIKLPSLEYFGVDILCEILSRVPARSIVWSCKLVCKRWLSLIRSPQFVESHRIQSETHPSLIIRTVNRTEKKTKFFSVEGSSEEDQLAILSLTTFTREDMLISSNGLFCLVDSLKDSTRIYNPSTGEISPSIQRSIAVEPYIGDRKVATYGFGFDPSTKKHKVVRVWDIVRRIPKTKQGDSYLIFKFCEVLTVGEDNTWRQTVERPPCISETSVTVNGSIYWMDGGNLFATLAYYRSLVAFDIGSEKFREISLPKSFRAGTIKLLEVDGCIAILHQMCDFEVKLWIFNDDKDNGKWIEEIISMPFDWDGTNLYQSIQQIPGTDIIILKAKGTYHAPRHFISLYHYDRKMKTFQKVKIIGLPALMMTPLESFSLPNSRATSPPIDYGFFTMIESLSPVQKQQQG